VASLFAFGASSRPGDSGAEPDFEQARARERRRERRRGMDARIVHLCITRPGRVVHHPA